MLSLTNFPLTKCQYLAPLFVVLFSLIAFFFNDALEETFIFDRTALLDGEWWRAFTGHIFHTNQYHLLLNLGATILLWSLHGQYYRLSNYAIVLFICAVATSLGVYYFSTDINYYVGLSGVLHGVFVWGACCDILHKEKTGYLLLLGVWLKIGHEQWFGASEDVAQLISASVAIDAHLFGAIGGMIATLLFFAFKPAYNRAS